MTKKENIVNVKVKGAQAHVDEVFKKAADKIREAAQICYEGNCFMTAEHLERFATEFEAVKITKFHPLVGFPS